MLSTTWMSAPNIHVKSKDNDNAVLPVNVDAGVRLEQNKFKSDEERADRRPPVR